MTRYRRKFHRIARRLTNLELQYGSDSGDSFSMEGVLDDLTSSRGSEFFMGFYSEQGIRLAFEKFGICKELSKLGYDDLIITTDTRDQYRQLLRLYDRKKDAQHMLGELVVHKAQFTYKRKSLLPRHFYPLKMIYVEWLVLQDPKGEFSEKKPQLPGQEYPGLGIGPQILELMYLMAKNQRTQGILIVPHYYHTAVIFSREFKFINPEYQAILKRVEQDLSDYSLPVRAWGVECGAVYKKYDNKRFDWEPEEQILACDKSLRQYLHSPDYINRVQDASKKHAFYLDTERLKQNLPANIELKF